jgi:hypothetical protein
MSSCSRYRTSRLVAIETVRIGYGPANLARPTRGPPEKTFADLMLTGPWLSSHCLAAAAAMSSSFFHRDMSEKICPVLALKDPGVGFERSIYLLIV